MEILTISILQEEAMDVLKDMSDKNLIKIEKRNGWEKKPYDPKAFSEMLKGSMTKQPIEEVDAQLKELREGW